MEEAPVFHKSTAAAALAVLAAATPASAAPSANDVRCFMLSNFFAQKADNEQGRRLALVSGFYYLGKLQEMGEADLRRHIVEQQKLITGSAANSAVSQMKACAAAVNASGQRIQSFAPAPAAPPARRK